MNQSESKLSGKLVFTSFIGTEDIIPEGLEVFIIDADGQNLKQLTDGPNWHFNPRFSPDGQTIAYVKEHPGGGCFVYLMNADGSDQRQVSDTSLQPFSSLDFSHDGQNLLFVNRGLNILNLADNSVTLVPSTDDNRKIEKAVFTADGNSILYEGEGLQFINIDGSGQRPLFSFPTANYEDITVSPDGSTVAFTERIRVYAEAVEDDDDEDSDYEEYTDTTSVFVCNLDGTGLRKISDGFSNARTPAFSPDGTHLALLGKTEGIGGMLTIRLDGTDLRLIENQQLQAELNPASWVWAQG